jgi:hypothetical protein
MIGGIFLFLVLIFMCGLALMLICGFGFIVFEGLVGLIEYADPAVSAVRKWWKSCEPIQRWLALWRIRRIIRRGHRAMNAAERI